MRKWSLRTRLLDEQVVEPTRIARTIGQNGKGEGGNGSPRDAAGCHFERM